VFPVRTGHCLILDAGANADCRPEYLLHFAIMGSIYAANVMGRVNPKVALINIGEEEGKGNALVLAAYDLLKRSKLNFIGNIEPGGFIKGNADVVVCDGFTGNIALKTAESVAEFLFSSIKEEIGRKPLFKAAAFMMKSAFRRVKTKLDHSEYGGAQLLGLKGVCVKSHGSADARTIRNAVKVVVRIGEGRVQELITKSLAEGEESLLEASA
jgi:glycerol-3-phosphate acyltransferase PlsX